MFKALPSIGNSDHDIVLLDTSLLSRPPKPERRKIYLWKSAAVEEVQEDLTEYAQAFHAITFNTIERMWESFKDKVHSIKEEKVPSKMTMA